MQGGLRHKTPPRRGLRALYAEPGRNAYLVGSCPKQVLCGIIPRMDFPIVDLFDDDLSAGWLLKHFHQNELKCPQPFGDGASRRPSSRRSWWPLDSRGAIWR